MPATEKASFPSVAGFFILPARMSEKGEKPGPPPKPPRHERSAGAIVFRDTAEGRRFLLLDYGRYFDFAKGHVEKGESDQATAVRETREETGIDDLSFASGFSHEINYFFRHPKRGLVRKTVVFFLASTATETVKISHEHVGYAWLDAEAALRKLKYASAKEVLMAAIAFLDAAASHL
jgi:bis(5'-nucleosidyl)-tetraphosphatase